MSPQTFLDASNYLRSLSTKTQVPLNLSGTKLLEQLDLCCRALLEFDFSQITANADTFESAEALLIQCKTDFAFAWSLAELSDVGSQANRGQWQTRFAEVSIDFALRLAWLNVALKHKVITEHVFDAGGCVPGLFIFGMGKLGGGDLNFSSDVDLVAYFDPEVLAVPDILGVSYVCHQVLQKLTHLLSQNGAADFIWRVDWRLRPNASATTLAMSVDAAQSYYYYQASPWHRLALMKARVVAGDIALGEKFLDGLSPFIWRQNLDFRALDELAQIKQRINLEHPALRTQRQWTEPIGDDIAGFNVKLGSGGIREIEFIANALQLVWGGRVYDLRTPNTVLALALLAQHQHLDEADARRLTSAYQALRGIENAIQILGNQQTHIVPTSESQQKNLLVLLGLESWQALLMPLNESRRFVHDMFSQLFAKQAAAQGDPLVWPEGITDQANDIIQAWEDGYHSYGVSVEVRHRLLPLTKAIAAYLNDESDAIENASDTIIGLHDFFKSLPSGEQYFRLLAESPVLIRSIIPPLLYSPAMTHLLKQSPHIIDCYVQGDWVYPAPFESEYVLQGERYELRLERLRRFVNEHLYQLYLAFLQGNMRVEVFQNALTDLAEHSLELALKIVSDHMQLADVPITVIGMGKIALRTMSPLSDLDLIFIYDAQSVSLELASRYVSRLQTAISTPMREGIVYELDTRLRPSGRSGAPTVSVESFDIHHQARARTWEHIALMSSRIVAGDQRTKPMFDAIKRRVICTPRSQDQFLHDALKMWNRITEHRVTDVPPQIMHSKLRVGGLMQAEYLAACLILKHDNECNVANADFDDLLAQSVIGTALVELPDIIQFWRIQQLWERLLGKTQQPLSSLPANYCARLLEHSGVSTLTELIEKKQRYSQIVVNGMDDLFAELSMDQPQIDDWQESPVVWL